VQLGRRVVPITPVKNGGVDWVLWNDGWCA
jgi:hypothetical protein